MQIRSILLIAALSTIMFAAESSAATISWLPYFTTNVSDATQVLTNNSTFTQGNNTFSVGNLVQALSTRNVTVNGVTFPGSQSLLNATSNNGGTLTEYTGSGTGYAGLVGSGPNTLLGVSATWNLGGTVTLSGLTSGKLYAVQAFVPYWNFTYNTKIVSGASTGGSSAVTTFNGKNYSRYAIGTFTADAATQAFTFVWGSWSDNDDPDGPGALLSAAQVREVQIVPEPTSLAGVGVLGGLAFLGLRRLTRRAV